MQEPLGRHHPWIRRLRGLRREAALRRAEGLFLAEGFHLAREALAQPDRVALFLVSPRLSATQEGADLLRAIEQSGRPCHRTTDAVLDSVQDARSTQPILTVVRSSLHEPEALVDRAHGTTPALLIAAYGVQDPGNLGTLFRTAEAAGAQGCFICEGAVDPLHPRCARSSAGSILRLALAETPVEPLLSLARRRGLVTIGAAVAGGVPYDACDLTRPLLLFVGGEGAGLPPALLRALDERVTVPMRPPVESLSVAAAAAVLLFEAARQRRT